MRTRAIHILALAVLTLTLTACPEPPRSAGTNSIDRQINNVEQFARDQERQRLNQLYFEHENKRSLGLDSR